MQAWLLVALGSAVGGLLRYATYLAAARWLGSHFAWGTLAVNVAGSALIGWLAAALPASATAWRILLMTGVCGGYTTFSAFSLDTLQLARSGEPWRALVNVAASLLLCGAAVVLGFAAGRR